jgi:hypothetical protein
MRRVRPTTTGEVVSVILWFVSDSGAALPEEKALEVLRAAVEDARGQPGVYVSRAQVMEQGEVSELEEFVRIAEYLAGRGFIAEGVNQYDLFTVTLRGIAAGSR